MTHALDSSIFGAAFTEPRVVEALSDAAYVRAMLRFEAELARVQGELGIVPQPAADHVARAARSLEPDLARLSAGVLRDGVPTIALVAALREAVGPYAPYVHLGATSQDVMDTATVLCLLDALDVMETLLGGLVASLRALAREHRVTLMAARTHGQQAVVTSFGLAVATWAEPLLRHRARLAELRPRLARLQLGGAAGTLAALGPRAFELRERLASALGLGQAELAWHVQRDAFFELGAFCAGVSTSLGKMAADVILLAQTEVAEVSEAEPGARGASSCMPHKSNPMRSERILAAARAASGHLSSLCTSGVQEHQRGTHGWQLEWLSLTPLVLLAAGALRGGRELVDGLVVDTARMRDNLAAGLDLTLSEAAVGLLSSVMSSADARDHVRDASRRARAERRSLVTVLREQVGDASGLDWSRLSPERCLGHAAALVDALVDRSAPRSPRVGDPVEPV